MVYVEPESQSVIRSSEASWLHPACQIQRRGDPELLESKKGRRKRRVIVLEKLRNLAEYWSGRAFHTWGGETGAEMRAEGGYGGGYGADMGWWGRFCSGRLLLDEVLCNAMQAPMQAPCWQRVHLQMHCEAL